MDYLIDIPDDANCLDLIEQYLLNDDVATVCQMFMVKIETAENNLLEEMNVESEPLIRLFYQHLDLVTSWKVLKSTSHLLELVIKSSRSPREDAILIRTLMDDSGNSLQFGALLGSLKTSLQRMYDEVINRDEFEVLLPLSLETIENFLKRIDVPPDSHLSEHGVYGEGCAAVLKIVRLFKQIMSFTVLMDLIPNERAKKLGREFFLKLLGTPLAHLDMELTDEVEHIAECIVTKIFTVIEDPFECSEDYHRQPNDLSLGTFYYCVLHKRMNSESVPKVYSNIYILQNSLQFVTNLLNSYGTLAIEKGYNLALALLVPFDECYKILPHSLLHAECHSNFCRAAFKVITNNRNKKNARKHTLECFYQYFWLFDSKGRYLIMYNSMRVITNSRLKSLLISQYLRMLKQEETVNIEKQFTIYDNFFNDYLVLLTVVDRDKIDDFAVTVKQILHFLLYLLKEYHESKFKLLKMHPEIIGSIHDVRHFCEITRDQFRAKFPSFLFNTLQPDLPLSKVFRRASSTVTNFELIITLSNSIIEELV